jgi:hypothetical protein
MRHALVLLVAGALVLAAARPGTPGTAQLVRPHAETDARVSAPVQTLPGNYIGCVIVPTPSTRVFLGLRKVHPVACVEATTGEVLVAVLRRNGTLLCSGRGYLDRANLRCATVNVCGRTDYYCLF